MDSIERYLELQSQLADALVSECKTSMTFVRGESSDRRFDELRALRTELLDEADRSRARGFLESRMFDGLDVESRLGALVACFELDDEVAARDLRRRFVGYDRAQPLFALDESLWPGHLWERELVAISSIGKQLGRSELVQLANGWARIDPMLPPELFRWVRDEFSGKPLWVRLDPWFGERAQPDEPLRESAIRPARPGWWRGLSIKRGEHIGASYALDPPATLKSGRDVDRYYEFFIRRVRRLEMKVVHSNGRIEFMIEELTRDHDRRLIGRMIHLDTGELGGDPNTAEVMHLDLAINAYLDADADARDKTSIANGTMYEATTRTHLLRLERVPVASCLELARQFFLSSALVAEWQDALFT